MRRPPGLSSLGPVHASPISGSWARCTFCPPAAWARCSFAPSAAWVRCTFCPSAALGRDAPFAHQRLGSVCSTSDFAPMHALPHQRLEPDAPSLHPRVLGPFHRFLHQRTWPRCTLCPISGLGPLHVSPRQRVLSLPRRCPISDPALPSMPSRFPPRAACCGVLERSSG